MNQPKGKVRVSKTKPANARTAKKATARRKKATSGTAAKAKPKTGAKVSRTKAKSKAKAKSPLPVGVTSQQRHQLIAEAAFFRAEVREFRGGDPVQDWLEAEKEIDQALRDNA